MPSVKQDYLSNNWHKDTAGIPPSFTGCAFFIKEVKIISKLIGIDQATRTCGFCLIDIATEEITRLGTVSLSGDHHEERINKFKNWLHQTIIDEDVIAVFMEDVQYQNNQRTFKMLSEMLGVIKDICFTDAVQYFVVAPVTWKSHCNITGKKRAEQKKNTIQKVKEYLGKEVEEDTSDAICIAMYGLSEMIKYGK